MSTKNNHPYPIDRYDDDDDDDDTNTTTWLVVDY